MARLPFLACLESESHAVVGGGRKLGAYPARSADHGLHLQVVGFKADALKEFDQDIQCCLEEHRIQRRKVGVVHIKDSKNPRTNSASSSSPWSFAASRGN